MTLGLLPLRAALCWSNLRLPVCVWVPQTQDFLLRMTDVNQIEVKPTFLCVVVKIVGSSFVRDFA